MSNIKPRVSKLDLTENSDIENRTDEVTDSDEGKETEDGEMKYGVGQYPPWHITLLYGFQQALGCMRGPISVVFVLHPVLCAEGDDELLGQLMSVAFFVTGLSTLLQATFGLRMPVVMASSLTFMPPVLAMMSTDKWACDTDPPSNLNASLWMNSSANNSFLVQEPKWRARIREVSGGLLAASCVQFVIGCTGAMGFLMNYIGPLTVTPVISLVGLSLYTAATNTAKHHWGIFILTVGLILIFSLLLGKYDIPFPAWSKTKKCHRVNYPVFKLFPYILAMGISWAVCYALTKTGKLTNNPDELGYRARTDFRMDIISKSRWFFFPYPCMWGTPTINPGIFLGMLAGVLSSTISIVGVTYATANVCRLPPAPKHTVNRSIVVMSISNIVSSLVGACHCPTPWSSTIGFIGLTGMSSRIAWQVAGIILLVFGVIGKVGAALSTIPEPIIGGATAMGLGVVIAVGLNNVRYINMKSSRNLSVLGITMITGIMVPEYLKANPGIINTGNRDADQVLTSFLSTAMFLGGVVGFALDNIIPGTKEERGITAYLQQLGIQTSGAQNSSIKVYDLPVVRTACLKKSIFCTYVPFMPSYTERSCKLRGCCGRGKKRTVPSHETMEEAEL